MRESFQNDRDRIIVAEVLIDKLTDSQKLTTTIVENISKDITELKISHLEKLDLIHKVMCCKLDEIKDNFQAHCITATKECSVCKETHEKEHDKLVSWKVYAISVVLAVGAISSLWAMFIKRIVT